MWPLVAVSGLVTIGGVVVAKTRQLAAWVADKIIPTPLGSEPQGGLFVTVHPRAEYGPPAPPSSLTTSITAWQIAAVAALILSLGYLAKNVNSFFR